MASTTPQRRSHLRTVAIAALFLVLTACSPGDQGRVIRDVALDTNGHVVEIDSGENWSTDISGIDESTLTEVGQTTEACLDDGTCIRITDGRRIEESTDQWETTQTVWQIEPNATWWHHQFGNSFFEPVVGLFDIVVLPDQSVAVASGELPLIERSVDGEWTPTVADLRTLPNPALLVPVIAAVLLVGALAVGNHRGTRLARIASMLIAPGFLIFIGVTVHAFGSDTFLIIVILLASVVLAPLALVSVGLSIEAARRAALEPGLVGRIGATYAITTAITLAASAGIYLLWSNAYLSWLFANALWIATMAAAVSAMWQLSKRTTPQPSSPPPVVDSPMSLPLVIIVTYILGAVVTVALFVAATAIPFGGNAGVVVGLALWLGLGGWVCSTFAARVPHESAPASHPVAQLTSLGSHHRSDA